MFDLYHVFLFLHIAATVAWIGGGLLLTILAQQTRTDGTPEEMAALLGRMDWFSKRFFAPLSGVVLLMGIGMAMIGGLMSAPWVSIGFVGVFLSAAIGMAVLAPRGRQLQALVERHGTSHPEVVRLGDQMLLISRLDLVVLMLVVAVMVFKPGAV